MKKVRWGVISTANIGVAKVIPAMQRGTYSEVTAIASRDPGRAQAAASKLGLPKAYGSYEALLADPDVDAVYNPLPNHLHVPVSLQAIDAGKHVLVEKPVAVDAGEAEELVAAAERRPQLKVMEAFMYRHHPQWVRARELTLGGALGNLRTIQTCFSYHDVNPDNVRNRSDIAGGGGLMDIGCYPVSLSRFLFGAEPTRVFGIAEFDPEFQVDVLASGILQFASGTATFTCSMQVAPYQRVLVFGTHGHLEIEWPFNAPPVAPHYLRVARAGETTTIVYEHCDQYTIQGDLMSKAILDDTPVPTPLSDAVGNMRALDALFRSSATGAWV
jgi:predicted dehydrogenase